MPKKIKCTDTTGRSQAQLVKGKDDLRQDAVMQQVFSLVNRLLSGQGRRGNSLRVRQYKVQLQTV